MRRQIFSTLIPTLNWDEESTAYKSTYSRKKTGVRGMQWCAMWVGDHVFAYFLRLPWAVWSLWRHRLDQICPCITTSLGQQVSERQNINEIALCTVKMHSTQHQYSSTKFLWDILPWVLHTTFYIEAALFKQVVDLHSFANKNLHGGPTEFLAKAKTSTIMTTGINVKL